MSGCGEKLRGKPGNILNLQWFHDRETVVSCRICVIFGSPKIFDPYCGWLRNPARLKAYEQWNKPSINWCRISQPSTIVHGTAKI